MLKLLKELESNKVKLYEVKNSYKDLLSEFEYEYFVTLTFKYTVSEKSAYEYLEFFLHLLNQKVIGKGYKKKNPLEGFVVLEKQWDGNPHFHLIVNDNDNESIKEEHKDTVAFSRLVDSCCTRVKSKSVGSYSVMQRSGVNVQTVDEADVIDYEIKTLGPNARNTDSLSPFKGSIVYKT